MGKLWTWIFAATLLAATPGFADNTKTAKWGQVEGWRIAVDRSVGNGCFASQQYEDGTSIRIGFDLQKKSIYFMLGNATWKSLEAGKIYQMRFVFDDQRSFNGELTGLRLGDVVFLDHSDVSLDFAKAFMERSVMRVFYQGTRITSLSLKNTYAAVTEVANCQRELTGGITNSSGSSDPFANPDGKRDPFAR